MNTTMANEFLTRCFFPGETIALLLRREEPTRVAQRIVTLEQATAPTYMRWLAHENANGMNVYVAANPLRSSSCKRTKECIAEIRHVYLDIDCDGDARITALESSKAVPEPTTILSTSPGKYQVLWRVEGFDFALQEGTLKQLAIAFGGDTACTDCNRVVRLPGFRNAKYTPAHLVTASVFANGISKPEDFRLLADSPESMLSVRRITRVSASTKHTRSEQDWAWVLSELSSGREAVIVTEALAARRADKPNPRYYAQRTVDVASARLALLGGTSIHNVIAQLEYKASSDIPTAFRSARAREIAHTAARMIARRNLP